jgi:hypothetical protein
MTNIVQESMKMINNTDANNCAQTHLFATGCFACLCVSWVQLDHFFKSFNLLIFLKRFENDKYRPGIDENGK